MVVALLAVLIAVPLMVTGALAAKLICISHQNIKGEMSVNKCMAKGMEFAVLDDHGIVRILSRREIELTQKINPKAFETPGFGLKHYRLAP